VQDEDNEGTGAVEVAMAGINLEVEVARAIYTAIYMELTTHMRVVIVVEWHVMACLQTPKSLRHPLRKSQEGVFDGKGN
jgi:hypothetical protein